MGINTKNGNSSFSLLRIAALLFFLVYSFVPYEAAQEGAAVIYRTVAALFFLFYLGAKFPVKLKPKFLAFLGFLFLFSILGLLVTFSFRFFVFSIVVVMSFYVASNVFLSEKFRLDLKSALELFLVFSSMALVLQFFIWRITGTVIEVHEVLYPWSAARVEDHGAFARLGGMYIEPGTFSNWTFFFVLIYKFIDKSARPLIVLLAAVAMIVSMSVWGILAGSFIVFFEILNLKKNKVSFIFLYVFTISALGTVFLSEDMLSFIQVKAELESESGDSKVLAYTEFGTIADQLLILGQGFAPSFCSNCLAPQDAGVFVSLSVVFGLFFATAIFALVWVGAYKRLGWKGGALILFLPVSKVFYWDPVFWLLVSLCWFSLLMVNSQFKAESVSGF